MLTSNFTYTNNTINPNARLALTFRKPFSHCCRCLWLECWSSVTEVDDVEGYVGKAKSKTLVPRVSIGGTPRHAWPSLNPTCLLYGNKARINSRQWLNEL